MVGVFMVFGWGLNGEESVGEREWQRLVRTIHGVKVGVWAKPASR